jgi:hypothetical protein
MNRRRIRELEILDLQTRSVAPDLARILELAAAAPMRGATAPKPPTTPDLFNEQKELF